MKFADVAVVDTWNGVNGPPLSDTKTSKVSAPDTGPEPPQLTVKGFVFTCVAVLVAKLVGVSSIIFTIKASCELATCLNPDT